MNTTIALQTKTKDQLKLFGTKGQTYDEILRTLMEVAQMHQVHERHKWIIKNEPFHSADEL